MERMGTTQDNNITHICAGLFAHVDAGKTTLSEALLYKGGVLSSLGRVDNQDAFLDTDEQERARGIISEEKMAELEKGKNDWQKLYPTACISWFQIECNDGKEHYYYTTEGMPFDAWLASLYNVDGRNNVRRK